MIINDKVTHTLISQCSLCDNQQIDPYMEHLSNGFNVCTECDRYFCCSDCFSELQVNPVSSWIIECSECYMPMYFHNVPDEIKNMDISDIFGFGGGK